MPHPQHSTHPNVSLVAVGVLQLQAQHTVWRVVRMQRLLGHNPHVPLPRHVVLASIAEYHLSVLRAGTQCTNGAGVKRTPVWHLCPSTAPIGS